ncbi:MAG: dTMP kinase [Chloroflexota bacterium]|nr:dTMP kinase [Chloroflexota bacterium]
MNAPNPSPTGLFVTVEGPEGAGKTTQAARLARYVEGRGRTVTLVREPGGTELGERLREILLERRSAGTILPRADALLFNASRAQLVDEVIRPALDRGDVVIATRFSDSTLAYQGYGLGLPLDQLRDVERFATGGLVPARTVLLDVPVEVGLARKGIRDRTRFESAYDRAFHERVRAGFLELARSEPERIRIVDDDDVAGADALFERVLRAVFDETMPLEGDPQQARAGR